MPALIRIFVNREQESLSLDFILIAKLELGSYTLFIERPIKESLIKKNYHSQNSFRKLHGNSHRPCF